MEINPKTLERFIASSSRLRGLLDFNETHAQRINHLRALHRKRFFAHTWDFLFAAARRVYRNRIIVAQLGAKLFAFKPHAVHHFCASHVGRNLRPSHLHDIIPRRTEMAKKRASDKPTRAQKSSTTNAFRVWLKFISRWRAHFKRCMRAVLAIVRIVSVVCRECVGVCVCGLPACGAAKLLANVRGGQEEKTRKKYTNTHHRLSATRAPAHTECSRDF